MLGINDSRRTAEDFPPSNWEQLDNWLFQHATELRHVQHIPSLDEKVEMTAEAVQYIIKEADISHALEVERCIEELLRSGQASWDDYSYASQSLIKVRLRAATTFVSMIGLSNGSPILFPSDGSAFLKWLITDWWREQGVIEIAYCF